jgi:hypothetical protein
LSENISFYEDFLIEIITKEKSHFSTEKKMERFWSDRKNFVSPVCFLSARTVGREGTEEVLKSELDKILQANGSIL